MAKRRRGLRNQAQQAAQAGAAPQRHSIHRELAATRRDEHRAVRSTRSMGQAFQDVITQARRELRSTPGLTREDKATALATLATQRLTAQAGANFSTQEVHQDFASQRQDLRAQLADTAAETRATSQSNLAELLQAARERHQAVGDREDEQAFQRQQAKLDRRSGGGEGGLTPTQARAEKDATTTAKQVAANLIAEHGIPSSGQDWAAFERLVASSEGTDPIHATPIVKKLRKRSLAMLLGAATASGAGAVGTPVMKPGGYADVG